MIVIIIRIVKIIENVWWTNTGGGDGDDDDNDKDCDDTNDDNGSNNDTFICYRLCNQQANNMLVSEIRCVIVRVR